MASGETTERCCDGVGFHKHNCPSRNGAIAPSHEGLEWAMDAAVEDIALLYDHRKRLEKLLKDEATVRVHWETRAMKLGRPAEPATPSERQKEERVQTPEPECGICGVCESWHPRTGCDKWTPAVRRLDTPTREQRLEQGLRKILSLFDEEPKMYLLPCDPNYRMTYADSDRVDDAFIAAEKALEPK